MRAIGIVPAFAVAAVVAAAVPAHADVSSWLALGGGYSLERNEVAAYTDRATAFSALLGVGTTPRAPLVVGGVLRMLTHFSMGTDLSVAPRVATGGFARGDWGFAVDVAATARRWRSGQYGTYPLQGVLTLGAPWGLELALGADILNMGGPPAPRGGFAVLEIDLLRLTVMRQGSTDGIWKNPFPAGGRIER